MPNRKIRKIKIIRNPKTNKIDNLGSENELHRFLEEEDTLESIHIDEEIENSCGCFGPSGGKCGQCGNYSCEKCHKHCGGTDNPSPLGCGVPLCRECARYVQLPDGTTIPLCCRCAGKYSRKKIRNSVTRLLLKPGVEFEDNNE